MSAGTEDLADELGELARASVLLVACDYDGTLSPIVADPHRAFPERESVVALRNLSRLPDTHVAVISGRALRDLHALAKLPDEVHLVGSHGSEFDLDFAEQDAAVGAVFGHREEHRERTRAPARRDACERFRDDERGAVLLGYIERDWRVAEEADERGGRGIAPQVRQVGDDIVAARKARVGEQPKQHRNTVRANGRLCNVVGHSDISPRRKLDPGELFDWEWLAGKGVGLWPKFPGTFKKSGPSVEVMLEEIGYETISRDATIRAFQRRFRPENIDGECDGETMSLVKRLLELVA